MAKTGIRGKAVMRQAVRGARAAGAPATCASESVGV